MVVGLHLHDHVDLSRIELVHIRSVTANLEPRILKPLADTGVILVGNQRIAGVLFVRISNHVE